MLVLAAKVVAAAAMVVATAATAAMAIDGGSDDDGGNGDDGGEALRLAPHAPARAHKAVTVRRFRMACSANDTLKSAEWCRMMMSHGDEL